MTRPAFRRTVLGRTLDCGHPAPRKALRAKSATCPVCFLRWWDAHERRLPTKLRRHYLRSSEFGPMIGEREGAPVGEPLGESDWRVGMRGHRETTSADAGGRGDDTPPGGWSLSQSTGAPNTPPAAGTLQRSGGGPGQERLL